MNVPGFLETSWRENRTHSMVRAGGFNSPWIKHGSGKSLEMKVWSGKITFKRGPGTIHFLVRAFLVVAFICFQIWHFPSPKLRYPDSSGVEVVGFGETRRPLYGSLGPGWKKPQLLQPVAPQEVVTWNLGTFVSGHRIRLADHCETGCSVNCFKLHLKILPR